MAFNALPGVSTASFSISSRKKYRTSGLRIEAVFRIWALAFVILPFLVRIFSVKETPSTRASRSNDPRVFPFTEDIDEEIDSERYMKSSS
jgi:hypothetical protein